MKRSTAYLIIGLMAAALLALGGIALYKGLKARKLEQVLTTMPLRDDLRKHSVFDAMEDLSLVPFAAVSPDGGEEVSADAQGHVLVRNARTGSLRETLATGEDALTDVCFDTTGHYILARGSTSGRVHVWGPRGWMI